MSLLFRYWEYIFYQVNVEGLFPVPVRSKAKVCGCSPAEVVGSNLSGIIDVCCECCVYCQVEVSATN